MNVRFDSGRKVFPFVICCWRILFVLGLFTAAHLSAHAAENGAQPDWPFYPPSAPDVPVVDDANWCLNDIDRFVLRRLHANSLKPAGEAERLTLVRRLFFDLIGLPPTPAEIDKFVSDERDDAYEQLVDRLLNDSRYGERWGSVVARFGAVRGHGGIRR